MKLSRVFSNILINDDRHLLSLSIRWAEATEVTSQTRIRVTCNTILVGHTSNLFEAIFLLLS